MTIDHLGIIGAGSLGRSLGESLKHTPVQVLYYDRDESKSTTGSLEDLVKSCQVLFICAPSWANAGICEQIARATSPKQRGVVISFSKGVEKHFLTIDEILAKNLPKNYDFGLIYGPMIAEEITLSRLGAGVLTLSNDQWLAPMRNMFLDTKISLDTSEDMHSIAICGALKNIYGMAFGLVDGLQLGSNASAKLAVHVLYEMKQILLSLNANPTAAEGLAGLGDVLSSSMSGTSFNFQVGKSYAQGIAGENLKSEGLVSLKELTKKLAATQLPILNALDKVIYDGKSPNIFADILLRI